jgi:hypothetical protein
MALSSEEYIQHYKRLTYLENWYELAIRPASIEECHIEDLDLLGNNEDDLKELGKRCLEVRTRTNEVLFSFSAHLHEKALDDLLIIKDSTIRNAGKGLFFCPPPNHPQQILETGTAICYYTGHHHNYCSAQKLIDRSYLMCINGNLLVDAGPCPSIKARYINDPLDDKFENCKFVPDPKHIRCIIVATRLIYPGEELFACYGDAYWAQQSKQGTVVTSSLSTS